jgi:hypothetical protein
LGDSGERKHSRLTEAIDAVKTTAAALSTSAAAGTKRQAALAAALDRLEGEVNSRAVAPPNLIGIYDSNGTEVDAILSNTHTYTLVGSGFGQNPIIKAQSTSLKGTQSNDTHISTVLGIGRPLGGITQISVLNTETEKLSNGILVKLSVPI